MSKIAGWNHAGGGAHGHIFIWPALTAPVSTGGLRSFQSAWFGPDGSKAGGGFRSFESFWLGPDGSAGHVGATYIPTFRPRRRGGR